MLISILGGWMVKLLSAVVAALLSLVVIACSDAGAMSSSEREVARTVERWQAHVARDEPSRACALMTVRAKRQLAERMLILRWPDTTVESRCEQAAADAAREWTDDERQALAAVRVRRVTVMGHSARVRPSDVVFPPGFERIRSRGAGPRLVRVAGRWLIDDIG